MKKVFTKIAIVIAALTFTFTTTSCENEELMEILGQVLQNVLSGQGTKYNFTGTATGAYAMYSNSGNIYANVDDTSRNNTITNLSMPVTIGNNSASIEFPAVTVNGLSFPAISISNLSATASGDYINIDVSDNSAILKEGSLTVDGTAYPFYNIFLEDVTFTTDQSTGKSTLSAGTIQLYFGSDEAKHYVLNYTYNGTGTGTAASLF